MKHLKSKLSNYKKNLLGWRTNRKILVIESDDWGSIRMPSRDVYHQLLEKGIRVDLCPFSRYDTLASENDLRSLFDVLTAFRDRKGNHPVFTANCVVANPDFKKIYENNYKHYYYEPFTDTLKRYPDHQQSFTLWKEGMKEKVFFPQFHGREHLNVNRWLRYLQSGSRETLTAFDCRMFGISTTVSQEDRSSYQAAFDYDCPEEIEDHKNIIIDGLDLFERLFGFRSHSFIAPNGVWDLNLARTLEANGVKYIQGCGKGPDCSKNKLAFSRLGSINKIGQVYLLRNVNFEPAIVNKQGIIQRTLKEIALAFTFKKPVTICSHRLNYIGHLINDNRDSNLLLLKELLSEVTKQWPNVEFMNTIQLADIIDKEVKYTDNGTN